MVDTLNKIFSYNQLVELKKFGERMSSYEFDFAVFDRQGQLVFACGDDQFAANADRLKFHFERILECSEQAMPKNYQNCSCKKMYFDNQTGIFGITLLSEQQLFGTAILKPSDDLIDREKLTLARGEGENLHSGLVYRMIELSLNMLSDKFEDVCRSGNQMEKLGMELSETYEELVLLHKLSNNMKVTESNSNYLQMACDSLTDIVSVEGISILLDKEIDGEKRLTLTAGSGVLDISEHLGFLLRGRLLEELSQGKEAMLDSEVDSPFEYDWPDNIKNIIAVPLYGKNKYLNQSIADNLIGMMVAINRRNKADFDSPDVKLFNSVANGCAVFVENGRLFGDLKELFIGSLKALTTSIDAKDQYTRGHSERVAFISRWIAEQLAQVEPLDEEDIHRIYLAGLLHDIGKMGIDESVLRKQGRLTDEEYAIIKKHPTIGAGILSGIKQMKDIVPGVLSHHERIDGKGYPYGLTGEKIPLIAKIVGLADSFDAMTSRRVYRDALSIELTLGEIEKGMGSQFDERIAKVFIDSDVYHLWDMIRDDINGMYGSVNISRYGSEAVGALIK